MGCLAPYAKYRRHLDGCHIKCSSSSRPPTPSPFARRRDFTTRSMSSASCRCSPCSAATTSLKHELGRKLKESRRRGGLDLAERRARDVAVHGAGAVELRAVEDV